MHYFDVPLQEYQYAFSAQKGLKIEFQIDKFFTVIFHRPSDSLGSIYIQKKAQEAQEAQVEIRNKLTEFEIMILEMCMNEPATSKEILLKLGIKRSGSFKNSLTKLLMMGLLSQTIPDRPSSPKQKYEITELARDIIKMEKRNP